MTRRCRTPDQAESTAEHLAMQARWRGISPVGAAERARQLLEREADPPAFDPAPGEQSKKKPR